jgi:hypothetical protein
VGDVGEQRAERHHQLGAEHLGELDHELAERPPPKRRLRARHQDQVAGSARDADLEQLDGRPHDLARLAVDELDPRPGRLEVVELLGVDRGESLGVQRRADELDRAGGGVSRIVPALEPADQCRGPQSIGTVLPLQWLHPVHGTS